jgi:hypothetical protein
MIRKLTFGGAEDRANTVMGTVLSLLVMITLHTPWIGLGPLRRLASEARRAWKVLRHHCMRAGTGNSPRSATCRQRRKESAWRRSNTAHFRRASQHRLQPRSRAGTPRSCHGNELGRFGGVQMAYFNPKRLSR